MTQKNDLCVNFPDGNLNVRVAALFVRQNKVLLEMGAGCNHYCLPGGRVQFGESAEEALAREIKEELKADIKIVRCLYVHQCFFPLNENVRCHEIAFYFLAESSSLPEDAFKSFDGDSMFYWVEKGKLKDVKFFPLCIKENINDLPKHTQLVQTREE
ncbi:MAG: NUDIX domain-containing protein [Corallococcus sp.]|nr:NUDIX domain-containing protein [Corallococcus sp.]MCM1359806.1 NUDIX domain-containing protein [Corallococcus sp.]MCM1395240.1 NUDIX domain-containing protein [Corallococcus sp.]